MGLRLEDESFTDLKLTLSIFELPTGYWDDEEYPNQYAYVVDQLKAGTDAQLAELHRHLFPDETAPGAERSDTRGPWATGSFRLFISHTTGFRESAGRLRKQLTPWGVDAFVAHDVIEPTREWQEEIEAALRTCDAMCAMVTPEFVESRWCDQEIGFALARGIVIVPMKIGTDPHGFIAKLQAITIPDHTTPYAVADGFFDILARHSTTAEALVPAVVRRYVNSDSLENTRAAFVLLETIPRSALTDAMVEQVERAPRLNSQVGDAVLPGGRKVPDAARDLLSEVRPNGVSITDADFQPAHTPGGDEDIPF